MLDNTKIPKLSAKNTNLCGASLRVVFSKVAFKIVLVELLLLAVLKTVLSAAAKRMVSVWGETLECLATFLSLTKFPSNLDSVLVFC
jgi:hypothetical protein